MEVLVRRTIRGLPLLLMLSLVTLWPGDVQAQYRVGVSVGFGVGPYYPYPYYPFYPFYRPFYRPFYSYPFYGPWYSPYGFSGAYYYPGYYGPGYPGPGWYDEVSSARLQVKPRHAEVFVDGYFVGLVDDFDGWAQRLHVPRGEHELTIYLAGYRTWRQKVLFRPGGTVNIQAELQPQPSGEPAEARPAPVEPAAPRGQQTVPGGGRPVPAPRRGREAPSDYGAVAVRVQPLDADIFVDGERWQFPEGSERLVVELSEGEHVIDIHKEGYRSYSTTVRVRRGETVSLNVSLTRSQSPVPVAKGR
jgi:hypothetical protein